MNLQPIAGQPGLFRDIDDPNTVINIREFREGDYYDTVAIPTGNIAFGTQYVFFQDIQNKRAIDTNFRTPGKLAAGESMILDRIGLYVRSSTGQSFPSPQDIKTVVDNGYFNMRINDILQDEGPVVKFPSGLGLSGQTNENGQGIVSVGAAATASVSRLVSKQTINQNHSLYADVRFDARSWLTQGATPVFSTAGATPRVTVQAQTNPPSSAAVLMTCFLHGLIRSAVSKG